ncbi:hypothetical protein B7494_g3085 [Chlorociboria aeruginascens]|nr:hypothetical protein B7494_g3085 [Chlorociboria aeruginascens]
MVEADELTASKERVTKRRKTDEGSSKAPRPRVKLGIHTTKNVLSYHAECVGVDVTEQRDAESWACPACALLGLDEPRDSREEIARLINVTAGSMANGPREGSVPKSGKRDLILNQDKGKKRSRYSTLPNGLDEALAIINRELEAAAHSKSLIAHMNARLHVAEQDLAIERGRTAIAASKTKVDELFDLKEQARHKDLLIEQLRKDNTALKAEAEEYALKVKELEDWKQRMRMMIDGNMK